jgi:hypothetical protein
MIERGEDIFVDPRGYPEEWEGNVHRPAYWDELVGINSVVRTGKLDTTLKYVAGEEHYILTMRQVIDYVGLPTGTITNVSIMREISKCMKALGWEKRDANTKPRASVGADRKSINGFYLKK